MEGKKILKDLTEITRYAGQHLHDKNPLDLRARFCPNLGGFAQIWIVLPKSGWFCPNLGSFAAAPPAPDPRGERICLAAVLSETDSTLRFC